MHARSFMTIYDLGCLFGVKGFDFNFYCFRNSVSYHKNHRIKREIKDSTYYFISIFVAFRLIV